MYHLYHVTVDFLQGILTNCDAYVIIFTCSKVRRMCRPRNLWRRSLQDDLTGSQTRQIAAGACENCQPKVAKISETQQKKPITAYELLTVNITGKLCDRKHKLRLIFASMLPGYLYTRAHK